MRVFSNLQYSRRSLRRKLFGSMLLLTAILMCFLASGLFLSGRFSSTKKETAQTLALQMEVFERDMASYWEKTAVLGIHLSQEMTRLLEGYLTEQNILFEQLTDSAVHIAGVQEAVIGPLCQSLRQSDCSGAFVLFNTTVNSSIEHAETSRSGLYIQKSGNAIADDGLLLYRGLADAGKGYGVIPHRKWRLEFQIDLFPNYEEFFSRAQLPLETSYRITDLFVLPGTSEQAVLMTVPLIGQDGAVYGLCGFEVSQRYFKLFHGQPTNLPHMVCLLTAGDNGTLHAEEGLSCGISNGYYFAPKGNLTATDLGGGLTLFSGEDSSYIGVSREVFLSYRDPAITAAVLIPKEDYDRAIIRSTVQTALLVLLLLFFTVVCCFYFSRRFISPILKSLDKIKSEKRDGETSPIAEIDDLFAFLAEQDREHERTLAALDQEKQKAQNEKERLQDAFDRAQEQYESAQAEISRLAYSRKQEVDPADYQQFLHGIGTLTPTEQKIFAYYLSGKSVKEILAIAAIKESTLRYHNKNIYSKLGVNSLKQLLRYAALMQQDDGGKTS